MGTTTKTRTIRNNQRVAVCANCLTPLLDDAEISGSGMYICLDCARDEAGEE